MTDALTWLTREDLDELGFRPAGPETDLGMRWGSDHTVRISFAPRSAAGDGYLYAYDTGRNRYAVLCPETTMETVESALLRTSGISEEPDGHVTLATELVGPEVETDDAVALWTYCVQAELVARRQHESVGADPTERFAAARAVVLAQAARVSTEDLIVSSLAPVDCAFGEPAIVRYRVAGRNGWTGRVVGTDLTDAAFRTADLRELADRHGYTVQATSLTQGHARVAAHRVPELEFAARPHAAEPTSSITF